MKTLIHIVGARPNFIKAAPLINKLATEPINNIIVHTGQHYDYNMSKTFFEELEIPEPNYHLGAGGGSHTTQTTNVMLGCERVFNELKPDGVIVYGDINSCMAAAIVASKMHLEGMNKITIIHSLVKMTDKIDQSDIKNKLSLKEEYALITMHRPSNVDSKKTLKRLMDEIISLAEHVQCVMPLHPRTRHRLSSFGIWKQYENQSNLKIIEPVGYLDFMNLQKNAKVVITDSGGIQEESSFFNVPCLTVRDNTERPITITKGTNKLIGTKYNNILSEYKKIDRTTKKSNIKYWDGNAAQRIVEVLKKEISW